MTRFLHRNSLLVASLLALLLVGGCFKQTRPGQEVTGDNVPSSYDVTVTALKDSQFELNGVPMTSTDLHDALVYMKDQSQPLQTLLLQRGEKQRVTDSYIVPIARFSHELGFRAFIKDKDGISEIRTNAASDTPADSK